jgi:peptide chain release factor 2
MILLPDTDKALLQECEIETFRSSGKGGQHVNKVETGVRLRHLPSGVVVTSQKERSQHRNKVECLKKIRNRVDKLNYRKPVRVETSVPRAVRRKNSEAKKMQSQKKRVRATKKRISIDD